MNKPNIILITPHDLGTHIGCYGWDKQLSTPNLDKLAEEGVRFTNNFCTAPFCSPSRGSIFSGKYPHTNGLMGLAGGTNWEMDKSNKLLGNFLQEADYETFLFGLQHITKDPSWCGFDHLFNQKVQCTDVASMVCDFLENRKDDEQPFYAEVGFFEVHRTYQHLDMITTAESDIEILPYLDDTAGLRADQCMLYADIKCMDEAVGRIIRALDAKGFSDNTLFIFTTDHGLAFPRAKATLYDAGINTALIMRHPSGFTGNRVIDKLISTVDILPTILDTLQIPVPEDIQGHSFLPLLRGIPYQENELIFAEKNSAPNDIKRCVRNKRYKYIRNFNAGPILDLPVDIKVSLAAAELKNEQFKPRAEAELYDLEKDPYEQINLASNPDYAEIEKELSEKLTALMTATKDQALSGKINRPEGEAEFLTEVFSGKSMAKRKERQKKLNEMYKAKAL